ncbi:hypothetical protein Vafri_20380, partial [Volvox africanus]
MRATTRKGSFKVMRVATSDSSTHVLGIHVEPSRVADVVGRIQKLQPCKPSQLLQAAKGMVDMASDPGGPGPSAPPLLLMPPPAPPLPAAAAAAGVATAAAAPGKADGKAARGDGENDGGGSSSGFDDGVNANSADSSENEEAMVSHGGRTASRQRRSGAGAGQRRRQRRRRKSKEGDAAGMVEDQVQEGERAERQEALQGAGLWEESSFLAFKKV